MVVVLLFVLSLIPLGFGLQIFSEADNSIHQIVALVLLVIAAILFSSSCIVAAIDRIKNHE